MDLDLVECKQWSCRLRRVICIQRHLQHQGEGIDIWKECRACEVGAQRASSAGVTTVARAKGIALFVPRDLMGELPLCACGCGELVRESRGPRPCIYATPECRATRSRKHR